MEDLTKEFVKYVKDEFGYDIEFKKSKNHDDFNAIFGFGIESQGLQKISKKSQQRN